MLRWLLIVAIVLTPLRGVMAAPLHPDAAATTAVTALSHCHDDSAHVGVNPKSERFVCLCKQGCWGGDCGRGCCIAHATPAIPTMIEAVCPPPIGISASAETNPHSMLFSSRRLRPPIAFVS